MELGVDVVRAAPARVDRGVCSDDVVVRKQVAVSQLFNTLAVEANSRHVGTDLGLGKDHSDLRVHGAYRTEGVRTA